MHDELNKIKMPEKALKTSKLHDGIILSFVSKNFLRTWREVKNTMEKVDVSFSKSTIKRCLHACEYR